MNPLAGRTTPRGINRRLEEAAEPTGPVITLEELKSHLRVTHSTEDTYIASLERTAVGLVQRYISKRMLSRQMIMWVDMPPGFGPGGDYWWPQSLDQLLGTSSAFRWIELMTTPLASFTSFQYVDLDNVAYTFDASNYYVDSADPDQPARVVLNIGSIWPTNTRYIKSLKFTYVVGYGAAASNVPEALKWATRLVVAALWSNRGDNLDQPIDILQLPTIKAILDQYRLLRLGGF